MYIKGFMNKITIFRTFNPSQYVYCPSSSPAHLFTVRGRRKRGPGTLQTRDQNLPK